MERGQLSLKQNSADRNQRYAAGSVMLSRDLSNKARQDKLGKSGKQRLHQTNTDQHRSHSIGSSVQTLIKPCWLSISEKNKQTNHNNKKTTNNNQKKNKNRGTQ